MGIIIFNVLPQGPLRCTLKIIMSTPPLWGRHIENDNVYVSLLKGDIDIIIFNVLPLTGTLKIIMCMFPSGSGGAYTI